MAETPNTPATPHHADAELEVLKTFMNDYAKPGITMILAVAILVTGVHLLRSHRQVQRKRAAQQLATARSANDLEAIVVDYAKTPSAPLALLAAAKNYYDSGNYDVAESKYDEFLAGYSDHPMALAASLGKIHCREARGDSASLAAAATDYAAFATANPDSYLTPLATFGKARCLQQSGDLGGAQQAYDEFLLKNPGSPWQSYVENQRETVDEDIKRARTRILQTDPQPVLAVPGVVDPTAMQPVTVPATEPIEIVTPADVAASMENAAFAPPPGAPVQEPIAPVTPPPAETGTPTAPPTTEADVAPAPNTDVDAGGPDAGGTAAGMQ